MNVMATPFLPARAVLPTLCKYDATFFGASYETTKSTEAMSKPLAATSVATIIFVSALDLKSSNAANRCVWVMSPCNSHALMFERPKTIFNRCAWTFVFANTMVCFPLNDLDKSDNKCASFLATNCGLIFTISSVNVIGVVPKESADNRAGFLMDKLANSSTALVNVALNNNVCLCLGMFLTISLISSKKPISNNRSASSKTTAATSSKPNECVFLT